MKIENCRLCEIGKLSEPTLNFGKTPLANEFLSSKQEQELFPLEVCVCQDCGHYQLNESVEGARLFTNYAFVAGTSPVNVEHFRKYAIEVIDKFKFKPGTKILEIASNDGTLLQHFKEFGMSVLGIDPAKNIADIANKRGIKTIPEFFTEVKAEELFEQYGQFDYISANNVMAHLDDLNDCVKGVKRLLSPNGVFSFEVSYFLDVCQHNLFDTIYGEHKDYHLIGPLVKFFNKYKLQLFDVQHIDTHGGSIRVFVRHHKYGLLADEYYSYYTYLAEEARIREKVEILKLKIELLGYKLRERLSELYKQNKSLVVYGYPAKATTLLYALGIDEKWISYGVDDNALKQHRLSPGKHISIYSPEVIYEKQPDYILILAWNFADSIIEKCKQNGYKGKFIVPLPELKVIN